MTRNGLLLLLTQSLILLSALSLHADSLDFEKSIRPIFERHCAQCHTAEENNGGLNLNDSLSPFAETDSGRLAIVPKSPDESELLKRISSNDDDAKMPPEGPRVSAREIATLRQWISEGARWPASKAELAEIRTSEHWAFQPISDPPLPSVRDTSWPYTPVDFFIQAERETAGLKNVGQASAESLARRAAYAITGLPPTPEQVSALVSEAQTTGDLSASFAGWVDELLNEPSYGERWGRHWMDWVRYADTSGDNSDFPIPQAYLYRNYIIDSLNADVPYDRFLSEQLAGDLLPAETQAERNRLAIATGYLAMARRFGSLVETYPWHLTIEDTIDNVGRTMMGMTIACARCHDHKFDPVSTRDYYGLYGIFASTEYAFPGTELFQVQEKLTPLIPADEVKSLLVDHQEQTNELEALLKQHLDACRQRELENATKEPTASIAERRKMHDQLQSMLLKARQAGSSLADHLKLRPEFPTAYAVRDGEPTRARIQIKGEPTRLGAEVARKFPDVLGGHVVADESTSGRLELARWIASPDNPLTARVIVNRVWQRHFGQGLVATTSDFGIRGEQPSHPELLDWLASDFMRHGWSLKHLHRTIMSSHCYQLASDAAGVLTEQELTQNLTSDPANRYYWKFNRQRQDAESIRDTLLVLSRSLDATPQVEAYPIPAQKDWKYTQHHPFKDDYPNHKRSVYQMTKRLTAQPYMQTFDGPDPNVCTSDRDQSVTAIQALFFVNDEFLHEQADKFSSHIVDSYDSDRARIERAFYEVLGRPADGEECELLLEHLAAAKSRLPPGDEVQHQAFASLARSLLRLNEFLYID